MTKSELLTLDVLSLQTIIRTKTKEKEKLEGDIKALHTQRQEELRELGKPLPALQSALQLLRIESESLSTQIAARKKELTALEQLHKNVHYMHGQKIANLEQTVLFLESVIETTEHNLADAERRLIAKNEEIVSLTKQIATLAFEVENYQKTIILISNQEKELIVSLRGKILIEKKLDARIKELKQTHHIVVGDVLTERNKRLYKRHKQYTGMNKALDVQIERKRKLLK